MAVVIALVLSILLSIPRVSLDCAFCVLRNDKSYLCVISRTDFGSTN